MRTLARTMVCLLLLVVAGGTAVIFAGPQVEVADPDYDMKAIKTFTDAHVKAGGLMRQDNPNWKEIRALYESTMPVVRVVDAKNGTSYERELSTALENCESGNDFLANSQILGKGTQHVTYLAIIDEMDKMEQSDAKKAYAARVSAFFEGIRPTFQRRDRGYFPDDKTLETTADQALDLLAEGDSGSYVTARRSLESVMLRTFALSVYYEATGIEENVDTDPDLCRRKHMEAIMYYRIVEPTVEKRSRDADEVIDAMLQSEYSKISSSVILDNLQSGLRGIELL